MSKYDTLTSEQFLELATIAREAALEAGAIIKSYDHKKLKIMDKEGQSSAAASVVTEADHAAEAAILGKYLKPTLALFDQKIGMLSEETEDDGSRFVKDYFWCVDPLDGTLPFSEGKPFGYSVSIALVAKDGSPRIGVVYDPCSDTVYEAYPTPSSSSSGDGGLVRTTKRHFSLLKNGQVWEPATTTTTPTNQNKSGLIVLCDRSFFEQPVFGPCKKALEEMLHQPSAQNQFPTLDGTVTFQCLGGGVWHGCHMLEEHLKDPSKEMCYIKFPKRKHGGGSIWDFAATAALFEACSSRATVGAGRSGNVVARNMAENVPLNLNRIGGNSYMNDQGILYATSPAIAEAIFDVYRNTLQVEHPTLFPTVLTKIVSNM